MAKQDNDQTKVFIVDLKNGVNVQVSPWLIEQGFEPLVVTDHQEALGHIYNNPPDLIVICSDVEGWRHVIEELKRDTVYGHIPLITILNPGQRFEKYMPDDFIFKGFLKEELLMRIRLVMAKSMDNLDANPLTRLPGNYVISRKVQKKIDDGENFALAYVDIDNFKSFNDKYGFSRGDDAIRMTARILVNVIRRVTGDEGFVGHIGGDDFVFIIDESKIKSVCEMIIAHYDMIGPTFYDDDDRAKGCIETVDRQGNPATFPLLSLSISVVMPNQRNLAHSGEAAAIASELKKAVKKLPGSNYMVDRRQEIIAEA